MATLAGLSGCGPVAEPCRAGTLAVAVVLAGASVDADALAVAIGLDGGPALVTSLPHTAGHGSSGNVVVEFPRGYPAGSVAHVVVTARAAGAVIGVGAASATLSGQCQALSVTVAATAPAGSDLSPPGVDLELADDLSSSDGPADFAASDSSAAADLAPGPPDLTLPPPDLSCPGGGTELCFNGLDDDCDGHIDCDDSDCAPVAVCVPPTTTGFGYGTEEPAGGACPANTAGGTVYVQDPNGGGCSSSCSCGTSGCSTTLNLTLGCGGGVNTSTPLSSSCVQVDSGSSYSFAAPSGTLACSASGTAKPVTPPTLTSALSCLMTGSASSAGCSNGSYCVARGSKQCVSAPGATATCPSSYPNRGIWYGSYVDGRSCSCSCGAAAGGCSDPSVGVDFYDSKSCSSGAHPETSPYCSNAYLGAKVAGGCTLTVKQSSQLTFSGPSTVCCQ